MPRISTNASKSEGKSPFDKKNVPANTSPQEVTTMTEENLESTKPVELSNISIADLYNEMEAEVIATGNIRAKSVGITDRARKTIDGLFEATEKEELLLSAVVKIIEKQEGRSKMYNIVRSIASSKSASAKYGLIEHEGRSYIVRK